MDSNSLEVIAKHLKSSGALQNYIGKGGSAEHETAYAICEIIASARKITNGLVGKLSEESNPDTYRDALEEFREEIRHIAYHIRDSEYLSVVIDTTEI